jgi:hypothetical protein
MRAHQLALVSALALGLAGCPRDKDTKDTPDDSPPPSDTESTDADGDGYATPEDCDDADPEVHPGAVERCDGLDHDCDGAVDAPPPSDAPTWYADRDHDGWGDVESPVQACTQPADTVEDATDCDDEDAAAHPGATETDCDDPRDYNCDGSAGRQDLDGDGFWACQECDDARSGVNPDATEVCDDGLDNDCDGTSATCDWYSSAADVRFLGTRTADLAGDHVDFAGDVDGDGHEDILITAQFRVGSSYQHAAACLMSGPFDGDVSLDDATAVIDGLAETYTGPVRVFGLGDLDGDGFDDIGIGFPWYGGARPEDAPEEGAAIFLHGPVAGTASFDEAFAVGYGISTGDDLGYSLDAGDGNGDGLPDLLFGEGIGSPSDPGAAFAMWSPVSGSFRDWWADAIIRDDTGQSGGFIVAWAGDVDGDGIEDVLLGAPCNGYYDNGAAFLVLGPLPEYTPLSTADARFDGENSGDNAGFSVCAAGDVDADGVDDLLIGVPAVGSVGSAYLVLGTARGTHSLADAEAHLRGEATNDSTGQQVEGAGDANQDGFADILVGSDHSGSAQGAGEIYLLHGPLSGDLDLAEADVRIHGDVAGESIAMEVAGGHDANGDGLPDILTGAPRFGAGDDAGGAYLFFNPGW